MTRTWLVAALAAFSGTAAAQAPIPATPMFADDTPINLVIRGPLQSVIRSASRDNQPQQGTVTLVGGTSESVPVAISARGITRRRSETCAFPPLRLDLAGRPAATSYFAGQRRLKLVTHCRNDQSFQRFLLLEYAAYRLYNVLTPYSFRAKLATIDYQGADGRPMVTRSGFFIEDMGDVARRNGLTEMRLGERVPTAALRRADAARMALFEYMIGNLDWSMTAGPPGDNCCHNSRLAGASGTTTNLVPIPYDFDFSGMVGAPYAVPPDGVPVRNVRQRHYRGYCFLNAEAPAAAAQFRARRNELLAVLDSVPGLEPRAAGTAKTYLEGFFAAIATDADVTRNLLKSCR